MTNAIQCNQCGKFISYADLDSGKATRFYEPDSEFGPEITDFLCRKCSLKDYLEECSKVVATWPSWKRNIALTHNERQFNRFNKE